MLSAKNLVRFACLAVLLSGCAATPPMHVEAIADPELSILAPASFRIERAGMSSHARGYLAKRVWPVLDQQVKSGQVLVEDRVAFKGVPDLPQVQESLKTRLGELLQARGLKAGTQKADVIVDVEFLTSSYCIAADPPPPGCCDKPTGYVHAVAVRVLKAEGGPGFLWRGHAVLLDTQDRLEARAAEMLEAVMARYSAAGPGAGQ